ncbi:hypothetical protein M3Y94_00234200 [Aphelenchoides besseyi]|nr:hypothetical protein M3Y94_00234200 [Aphelenchoides besseyi]KAI6236410.1 hypothetical protein M3Y95_00154600 [Aphelenchoides besseyi]
MNSTVENTTTTLMNSTDSQDTTHLCDRPGSLSRFACCHFVLMLNDTTKIPLCEEMRSTSNVTNSATVSPLKRFTNSYSTPVYLSMPSNVPEDHGIFIFGVLLLTFIALFAAFVLVRLTKPKYEKNFNLFGFARLPANLNLSNSADYDIMMWLRHQRRSSMLLYVRSMACRPNRTRQTSLSVVSNSSLGLLPTYRSAASTTTITPSSLPPPPYDELEGLTASQTTGTTYVSFANFDRQSQTSAADRNNNNNHHQPPNRRR